MFVWFFKYEVSNHNIVLVFRWRVSAMFTNSCVSRRRWSPWHSLTISGPVWRPSLSAMSTRKTQCHCLTWTKECLTPPNPLPPTWALSPTPKATCTNATYSPNISPMHLLHTSTPPTCIYKAMVFFLGLFKLISLGRSSELCGLFSTNMCLWFSKVLNKKTKLLFLPYPQTRLFSHFGTEH